MKITTYKELVVWQKSMDLVSEMYSIASQLPKFELYVLGSQMIRAAVSIPSNIAEGYKRGHRPEFVQFLNIASASSAELETQIEITKRQYPQVEILKAEGLCVEVQKMLSVMIKKLKNK
jgi:four helix bundle protein